MLFGVVAFCLNILDWCYLNAIDFLGSTLKISIVSGIIGGAFHIPKWNWGSCYSKISDWLWRMARQKPTHSLHGSTPQDAIVASLKACFGIFGCKSGMLSVGFSRKHFGEGVDPIPTHLLETRIRLFNLKIQAILPQAFGSKWVSGKNRWKNTRGPYLTFQDVRVSNHFQQPSQVEFFAKGSTYHPTKVPNLTLGHPSTMPS